MRTVFCTYLFRLCRESCKSRKKMKSRRGPIVSRHFSTCPAFSCIFLDVKYPRDVLLHNILRQYHNANRRDSMMSTFSSSNEKTVSNGISSVLPRRDHILTGIGHATASRSRSAVSGQRYRDDRPRCRSRSKILTSLPGTASRTSL